MTIPTSPFRWLSIAPFIFTITFCWNLMTAESYALVDPDETLLLWPDGAPGALGDEEKDKPQLLVYLPDADKANGCAIVIFPGGGYGHLAMGHEGHQIAEWCNSMGIAAFICDYRHRGKGYGHPAPLQDAQRAIRMVRANADQWKVDVNRLGVIGFSAGGHLASTTITHFDEGDAEAGDNIAKQSSRPDFGILCYPVIAFDEPYTHRGSQRNLLGDDASDEMIKKFSNEKQVTSETPPTFLWHTSDDAAVPPENSVQFYLALRKNNVPAEMHIYETGRHGLGLADGIPSVSSWPKRCQSWMEARELLKSTE